MLRNIIFALILVSCAASSQEQTTHAAGSQDFIGSWRVVLIPNNFQKSKFKNEEMGYSDPCQFFIHNSDNSWNNLTINNASGIQETIKQCPTSKAALAPYLTTQNPSQFKWEQMREGFFNISEANTKNSPSQNSIVWKADTVSADISLLGLKLKKGDMIMQIIKPVSQTRGEAVYSIVLRPLVK